jgi:hypothetical protein
MIKHTLVIITFLLVASFAQADPSAFFGVTYNFGAPLTDLGLSVKLLSDDEEDKGVVDVGVSYSPFAKEGKFGLDAGAGYLFKNGAVTFGWDFLNMKPQVGVGYVNTAEDKQENKPSAPEPPPLSDQRLKHDIIHLATLENGINLYSFKYNWSEETYVGVMAQELLLVSANRNAVVLTQGNYYAVDYQALGLRMITLNEWNQSHENIFSPSIPYAKRNSLKATAGLSLGGRKLT